MADVEFLSLQEDLPVRISLPQLGGSLAAGLLLRLLPAVSNVCAAHDLRPDLSGGGAGDIIHGRGDCGELV